MARTALLIATVATVSGCLFGGDGAPSSKSDTGTSNIEDVGSDSASNIDPGDVGTRPDVPDGCGDSLLAASETCDPGLPSESPGACPTTCDDAEACTADTMLGAPETCDVACSNTVIDSCVGGDGCCPGGCSAASDSDCTDTVVCGDGVLSGGERCDPGIAMGPGACPTAADCPDVMCQNPRIMGSPTTCDAVCAGNPITSCTHDDGCCAPGCDSTNDNDCAQMCGNGLIETGETCDGNCPTSCDDGEACTTDSMQGSPSTCDAVCLNAAIDICMAGDSSCPSTCTSANDADCSASCGDGVLDTGETCDPSSTCPVSCDDGDACTNDNSSGSAANCNLNCTHTARTMCVPDGCCAPGCNANNDVDCVTQCGNGITEPPETCDQNCPSSCDDQNACTTDTMTGSAGTCDLLCSNVNVTSCTGGDGCCPANCNATNDSDCGAVCGNGIVESGETCDGNCPASCNDGNPCTNDLPTGQASSCNVVCSYTAKTSCVNNDQCCPGACNATNDNDCSASCGNGITEPPEKCDGNCPSANSCTNMGPCHILIGSAAACTAECGLMAGCTECDRSAGGTCTCAAGQECNGGMCEASNGDGCTNACNPGAFCAVWGGPGWVCDANDDFCKECLTPAQCLGWETCDSNNACEEAKSCGLARSPNAWCVYNNEGNFCTTSSVCVTSCVVSSDCPPLEACHGTICEPADDCFEAASPDAWCEFKHGVGWGCSAEAGGDGCKS